VVQKAVRNLWSGAPEEETKLRGVLEAEWASHIWEFELAMHMGLQLSEMYGLDRHDVDLARRLRLMRLGENGEARYARLNSVALKTFGELRRRSDGTG